MKRMLRLLFVLGAAATFAPTAGAQATNGGGSGVIYLLSGLTSSAVSWTFPTMLHGFALSDGQLLSSTVVTESDKIGRGVDFIGADYPGRVIVIGEPRFAPTSFFIVDMDNPASVSHVNSGTLNNGSVSQFEFFQGDRSREAVMSVIQKSGDAEMVSVPLLDDVKAHAVSDDIIKGVRKSGFFGTASDNYLPMFVAIQSNAKLGLSFAGRIIDLGIPAPHLAPGFDALLVAVKNDDVVVLTAVGERDLRSDGTGNTRFHLYSPQTQTWKALTLPGSETTVRAFGRWLAFVVADAQPWAIPQKGFCCVFDQRRHRPSPGQDERIKNKLRVDGHTASPIDDMFRASERWFPGMLLLYDTQLSKLYRIDTKQGDSEVLLVEGSTVYYRVNGSLYSAKIGDSSIEDVKRIVTDPAIENSHWAFIPH